MQIDQDRCVAGTATAAAAHGDVKSRARVAQEIRAGRNLDAAAHRRLASLEFVDGEIDAVLVQRAQGAL
jgi:hypothetical protein